MKNLTQFQTNIMLDKSSEFLKPILQNLVDIFLKKQINIAKIKLNTLKIEKKQTKKEIAFFKYFCTQQALQAPAYLLIYNILANIKNQMFEYFLYDVEPEQSFK